MLNYSKIKNKTKQSLNYDELRALPYALREYYSSSLGRYDREYRNRQRDGFLTRFNYIKYNISDRTFGGTNMNFCNIFMNATKSKQVNDAIEEFTFNRQWFYHPVKPFESWNIISKKYYNNEDYFWMILLFNKILDPFTALENFNMIRIPFINFLYRVREDITLDFEGGL